MKCLVAGFDPGGKGKFGWCIARPNPWEVIKVGVADHAVDAFCKVKYAAAERSGNWKLVAAGIDAPLYWPYTGQSRKSDEYIRKQIINRKKSAGTVQAVNSLRGACLAQGVMLAAILEENCSACRVTETHPKALLEVCPEAKKVAEGSDSATEHERDAVISAWAAARFISGKGRNLYCCEDKKAIHVFLKKPWYWWPSENHD